jgi:hypothetical protein
MITLDKMPPLDPDIPATISWSDHLLVGDMTNGPGHSRHFDTAREALLFAGGLPDTARRNVWLMTEGHTYKPDEIEELRAGLG